MFFRLRVSETRFESGSAVCSGDTGGLESEEKAVSQVLVDEVKEEWKLLWVSRIDDKVRAEGIANRDYQLLFVERGTVIFATRGFRPLDFKEILGLHKIRDVERVVGPPPSVGGWAKFARTVLNKQKRARRMREPMPRRNRVKDQQLKKGGRGWLHQQ